MADFSEDAFVKIVGTNGNYRYGYIQSVEEKGLHLVICMHEEGDSALEYETASGAIAEDWDKMLTDTERQIIPLLAKGLKTKEVAAELNVSPITIRAQTRTLQYKLQLDNRQQLVAFAQGLANRLQEEKD